MSEPAALESSRAGELIRFFELTLGKRGAGSADVVSLRGREEISRPYSFDVRCAVSSAAVTELATELPGEEARLALRLDDGTGRLIHGVVASVRLEDAQLRGLHIICVRVVPRLWLLGQRKNSRVFQDKTMPEIVSLLLREHRITHEWKLVESYPRHAYAVQYQETDLAFVSRLLAEKGVFYRFEQPRTDERELADDGVELFSPERVVLDDSAHARPWIEGDPHLLYRHGAGGQSIGMHAQEREVHHFTIARSLRPASVTMRDYDFQRPQLDLVAEARVPNPPPVDRKHHFDHHGEYDETDIAPPTAEVVLEQLRRRAITGKGASYCRRLTAGAHFTLLGHESDAANGSYVITRVDHQGVAPEHASEGEAIYENRFAVLPADTAPRPRRARRRVQQVSETALVVGPRGQEIHTDEYGRVKVQFFWDKIGPLNDHSSCWLRVSQPWAGGNYGFQFVPRIGMEVLVTFLGGDMDRPVVSGCLHGAATPTPHLLPISKTRSGIRTRSSPSTGGGYNEIAFEDEVGLEQLLLSAHRDLDEIVGHDKHVSVRKDRTVTIEGDDRLAVQGDRTDDIGGDRRSYTKGDASISIDGEALESVKGNRTVNVRGISADKTEAQRMTVVGTDMCLSVGGNYSAVIGNGGSVGSVFVDGKNVLAASDQVIVTAEKSVLLRCGKSSIELTPEEVKIHAKRVRIVGDALTTVRGPASVLRLDGQAELSAMYVRVGAYLGATIQLDVTAKMDGALVLLNCGGTPPKMDTDDAKPPETKTLSLTFADQAGKPKAGQRFEVSVDGARQSGTTDGSGGISVQVPSKATAATVSLWGPGGERKNMTLKLEEMPDPSTPKGAMLRLTNLGYFQGEPHDALDDAAKDALRRFQEAEGLPASGELDIETIAKIREKHP